MSMVDLHTHSTCSDGSLTPRALMEYARVCGLTAIALTDHDNIGGLNEAKEKAAEMGIRFIAGVELEVQSMHGEFHVLGLGLTKKILELEKVLLDIQIKRKNRNHEIIKKMNTMGFMVSMEDIKKYSGGNIISRLHFARFLIAKGMAATVKQAFHKYLNPGKPFFVPKEVMTLEAAIRLIKASMGKVIAAHPFTLQMPWNKLTKYLLAGKDAGLDGIEAFHPDFSLKECTRLESFAQAHDFIITAGSDFHGENRADRRLGFSCSGMEIADKFCLPFLSAE